MAASYSSLAHCTLMLCFLLLASSAILSVNGSCDFAASCGDIGITSATLSASCTSVSGNSVTSFIDLNQHVGNNNGNLVCPGTGFGQTCSNIGLNGGNTLTANCLDVGGSLIQASLDLNSCISNDNGQLVSCV